MIKTKCSEARTFLSDVSGSSVPSQVPQQDLDFLSSNGYLTVMSQAEHDQASADVANLAQFALDLQNKEGEERNEESVLQSEEKKTHSILFRFENKEKKETELQKEAGATEALDKGRAEVAEEESKVNALIQKKSVLDRLTPYGGKFVALTGLGVTALSNLNVRNYRVSDGEFSAFVEESNQIDDELRGIADRAGFYVSEVMSNVPGAGEGSDGKGGTRETSPSQLWSAAIGLAKLQGDKGAIGERFLAALDAPQSVKSKAGNRLMAAEIMTSLAGDLRGLCETQASLEATLAHDVRVPDQVLSGIAAIIMGERRFDGTYPTDKFAEFTRATASYEAAAILSAYNGPSDQMVGKFQSFKEMFYSWGYEVSEDTELASALLAISELGPDDVSAKLAIEIDALKNYLEFPLVAAAILASIPTLEANETLDLMEKACFTLGSVAAGLQRSELVSLAVRMIHGIRNELVRRLDPTAKVVNTPVQFTYPQSPVFFLYYRPLIIVHSTYYATYAGIGGFHPAHVHGVGGFMG